jgi:hypothetical protein
VLGRVKDSSSHDSILFAFFAGEREDSRVFPKDSRAMARRESFQEKGQIGAKVFKRAKKKLAKWKEKLREKAFY